MWNCLDWHSGFLLLIEYFRQSKVDGIFAFSETGDLEKIRQSYELFASVFPLAPEHWLKWLRLELNIALSPAELKRVFLLFQRALSDYYCEFDRKIFPA